MEILSNVLENFKQLGMYAITLRFGDDIGADDLDTPKDERDITLVGFPVGCLGGTKVMFKGTLGDLLKFNLKTKRK